MTPSKPSQTILVIFGITGDLSRRKLLPVLQNVARQELLPAKIIGISRHKVVASQLLQQSLGNQAMPVYLKQLKKALEMFQMDLENPSDYQNLRKKIDQTDRVLGGHCQILFYLSVPPHATTSIVESLGKAGLCKDKTTKLLLEKPFGVDLHSAQEIIGLVSRYFHEDQIYRIDHYLAKGMSQNIIIFRTKNALFRRIWSDHYIESIDIVASEKIGVEGRAVFYEQTGALRDIIQGHLMQLAALTLMDVPSEFDWEELPELRLKALRQILPIDPEQFDRLVVRGQYESYDKEVDNPGSLTETFASLTLFSSDPNWQDVPIRLIAGKKLDQKTTEIRIYFKKINDSETNLLTLRIQPNEGVEFDLWAKQPGHDETVEKVILGFRYQDKSQQLVDAYERILLDAIKSKKSLFASSDEVLTAWEILQPVQQHWGFYTDDLRLYKPGSNFESILDNDTDVK